MITPRCEKKFSSSLFKDTRRSLAYRKDQNYYTEENKHHKSSRIQKNILIMHQSLFLKRRRARSANNECLNEYTACCFCKASQLLCSDADCQHCSAGTTTHSQIHLKWSTHPHPHTPHPPQPYTNLLHIISPTESCRSAALLLLFMVRETRLRERVQFNSREGNSEL